MCVPRSGSRLRTVLSRRDAPSGRDCSWCKRYFGACERTSACVLAICRWLTSLMMAKSALLATGYGKNERSMATLAWELAATRERRGFAQ